MKKKWTIAVIALVMLCMLPVSAIAAEQAVPGQSGHDVLARYIGTMEGTYTAPVEEGKAEIRTDDGAQIALSGIREEGLTLVVIPVTGEDREAFAWFEEQMAGTGTKIAPYDIYLQNAQGERVPFPVGVSVRASLPGGYTDPLVVNLQAAGEKTELDFIRKDGAFLFTAGENGYYVFAERLPAGETPDPSEPGSQPQTGDPNSVMPWIGAMILAAAGMLAVLRFRKKEADC